MAGLEDGFGNVAPIRSKPLVENLDHLIAFHTGEQVRRRRSSRISRTPRRSQSRGVALAHRQVGPRRLRQFGSQPTYVKMRQRRM